MLNEQPMTGTLTRVCSYCKQPFGTKPCVPEMDGQESHGCCPGCEPAMRASVGLHPRRRGRRTDFTVSAFVRSHGSRPRGRGLWGFRKSRTDYAFERDLTGPVVWAPGTLTLREAFAWMRREHPGSTWAVMP